MSPSELTAVAPYIILCMTGCLCLMLEVAGVPVGARKTSDRGHIAILAVLGLAAAGTWMFMQFQSRPSSHTVFSGALRIDHFGLFFGTVICMGAMLSVLVAVSWLRRRDLERGEYYAIVLFSTAGMLGLAQAADYLFMFVALETLSIGVYVLTGLDRDNSKSPEAALKYFLNGAFAAAVLLFGIALIYGATGSTELRGLAALLKSDTTSQPLATAGLVMVIVGLGFKIAAVPFHMWTPDAYEGSPAPATAFMAAGVKAASFAALIRVLATSLELGSGGIDSGWVNAGWFIAVATMSVGNLAALAQRSVKRMLAYSSVAHAGYALAGVVAALTGHLESIGAVGFYLLAYALMTVGSFGVVAFLERQGGRGSTFEEWAGAARTYPLAGLAMAIFIFSLAGIPPTAGFLAKFYLFSGMLDAGLYGLAFIAILNSLVSVYYYLRVLVAMYMRTPHPRLEGGHNHLVALGLAAAAILVLLVGLMPASVLELSSRMIDVVKG